MKTSDQINELGAALAKAQGAIRDAAKDTQGYNYSYANLASILQITRPLLSANGLSVMQEAAMDGDLITVTTRILHQSGQWVEMGPLAMTVEAKKGLSRAQCVGSVVTYARRYALSAALGITQDDDDGAQGGHAALDKEPTLPPIVKQLFASIRSNDGTLDALWAALTDVQKTWVHVHAPADIEEILTGLGSTNA